MTTPTNLTQKIGLCSTALALFLTGQTWAAVCAPMDRGQTFLSSQESSFDQQGWMKGSPPPAEKTLRLADGSFWSFPALRYSVAHMSEFLPTTLVNRRNTASTPLEYAAGAPIESITFTPWGYEKPIPWSVGLLETYTDGILVLHKGKVIYERYLGGFKDYHRHALMSVTKSITGTLALDLVHKGLLDESKPVSYYIPELTDSGFGDAKVRDILNMTTGIDFDEDYTDPESEIWTFSAAGNPLPKPAGYTGPTGYYEYLPSVKKSGEHGQAFGYKTANTEVAGWLVARVTGMSVADYLEEQVWSKLGVERDAFFQVDEKGTPFAGGGLNMSLRDLARFGELLRNAGTHNGEQILHQDILKDIMAGGEHPVFTQPQHEDMEGWSYRSMWWVTGKPGGAFMARGVHGQNLYIDPENELVIARFASHPIAANSANDCFTLPAYEALVRLVKGASRSSH
jgi:CubicO group peptidase (beta-lactamase class C family)